MTQLWLPRHKGLISSVHLQPRYTSGAKSLDTTLRQLGLLANLKLCLDVGDYASYPGTGQTWFDRSGNNSDFFVGATGSGEASDPTFNGVAGTRQASTFWGFGGDDVLRYSAANETWMNNLHKNNAIFTLIAWIKIPELTLIAGLFGSMQLDSDVGSAWYINTTTEALVWWANFGSPAIIATSTIVVPKNVWVMCAVSLNEATGANGGLFYINKTTESFTSTYTSPSASNATRTYEIASVGIGRNPLPSGSNMAMFAAWEGRALTAVELNLIYEATRARFGV